MQLTVRVLGREVLHVTTDAAASASRGDATSFVVTPVPPADDVPFGRFVITAPLEDG